MGNINFDSFYKFLVSLGIIIVILPFAAIVFLCTNSFDLLIPEQDLLTYTETARRAIDIKQSIPLLMEDKIVWGIAILFFVLGLVMIIIGLIKWYGLQSLDDRYKKTEMEMKIADAEKHMKEMSDEQIIQKNIVIENVNNSTSYPAAMKSMLIEQRFFYAIKELLSTHTVRNNIMIEDCEFDVVALANKFLDKDYVYEVKYIRHKTSVIEIDKYRENMKKQKEIYSDKMNRIPHMVLALIVPDELYEHTLSKVEHAEKWNNYSIEVISESSLSEK